jgi:hypothetical protein
LCGLDRNSASTYSTLLTYAFCSCIGYIPSQDTFDSYELEWLWTVAVLLYCRVLSKSFPITWCRCGVLSTSLLFSVSFKSLKFFCARPGKLVPEAGFCIRLHVKRGE